MHDWPEGHPDWPTMQYAVQRPVVSPAAAGSQPSPGAQSESAVHVVPAAPLPVLVTHVVAPGV